MTEAEKLPNPKKIKIAKRPIHKIGVFGGSFNPIHIGHVLSVHYVQAMTDFEGIFVVPCGNHAFGKDLIDFNHRFLMCQYALFNLKQPIKETDLGLVQNNIVISDIEKDDTTSYAIDTARRLLNILTSFNEGEVELYWIVGSDCIKELGKWKEIEELKKIVKFHEIPRPDSGQFYFSKGVQLPATSSSEVRKRIKEGQDFTKLLPLKVSDYVRKHKLYLA